MGSLANSSRRIQTRDTKSQANRLTKTWLKLAGHDRIVTRVRDQLRHDKVETARETLEIANQRFPKSADLKILNAKVSLRENDHAQAKTELAEIEQNPLATTANLFSAAKLYESIGDIEHAILVYQRIIDEGQGKVVGASSRAIAPLYMQRNQPNRALHAAVNCLRHDEYLYRYLMQQIEMQCSTLAIEKAIKAIKRIPPASRSELQSNRHQMLSYCYIKLDDWDNARWHIREATRIQFTQRHLNLTWSDTVEPRIPSFLIIGAMKSGTTALFDQMIRHPQIVPPLHKELQFFLNPEWPNEYYFDQFPRIDSKKPIISGEASPGYYRTSASARVKQMMPDVKLIFIQRDPVDRAISHYFHSKKLGLTSSPLGEVFKNGMDQIRALSLLPPPKLKIAIDAFDQGKRHFNSFLLLGCYELLLRSWREQFPEQQLLTVNFEDFTAGNDQVMSQVFDYLGVRQIGHTQVKNRNAGNYRQENPQLNKVRRQLRAFYDSIQPAISRRTESA